MPTCQCACGARYQFSETSAGKSARCRSCGQLLTIPDAAAQSGSPADPPAQPFGVPAVPIIETEPEEPQLVLRDEARSRGYGSALGWTLLFPSSVRNLAAFLTLWLIFGFLNCIPLPRISVVYFISIAWLMIAVWYAAFRVSVMEVAASGAFQLPNVEISGDIWGDLLEPALRWYGSWVVALSPALGYVIARGYAGRNVIGETAEALLNPPLPGVPGPSADALLLGLLGLGLVLWPMVVLVAIVGGFGYLWRLDRLFATILNCLAPYLLTVTVVLTMYGIILATTIYISPPTGAAWRVTGLGTWVLKRIGAAGIDLYASIVAARAIGLLFRHYGHRFAWDWGQLDEPEC